MKASYLEYYKTILEKVSFDDWLYAKEFAKARRNLSPGDFQKLRNWSRETRLPAPLTEEQLLKIQNVNRQFA